MLLDKLHKKKLIKPPDFLIDNTHYLVIMGSFAYGVSDDNSDQDIYGFCIPPKNMIFFHLDGEIEGFGRQKQRFGQWQDPHIVDADEGKEYDFQIYNIVKYFNLCMENNPNMLDSLFVPQNCVIHATKIANMVRERRKDFLHKGMWPKFKGYAYSQLHKMRSKENEPGSKRTQLREKYGFDTKFAYHTIRLLSQAEQILIEGDVDLQEKGRREHMKAIRRGEVSMDDIIEWASAKERQLEELYHKSKLPWGPDEEKIKQLLLDCLESHYGSLSNCITIQNKEQLALAEIKEVLSKYGV